LLASRKAAKRSRRLLSRRRCCVASSTARCPQVRAARCITTQLAGSRESDEPRCVSGGRRLRRQPRGREVETGCRWPLVHEQNVALGAPRYRLVDGSAEQSLKKAAFTAANDDQVGVPLVGDLQQTLGRIAQLDEIFGLELPAGQRPASLLELPPRQLLRLLWRYGLGQGTVPPGATGPATAGGTGSAVGSKAETGVGMLAYPLALTISSWAEKACAMSAARPSARWAASDPS
jgi:hypothetical protein